MLCTFLHLKNFFPDILARPQWDSTSMCHPGSVTEDKESAMIKARQADGQQRRQGPPQADGAALV